MPRFHGQSNHTPMDVVNQLRKQYADYLASLFHEGVLDDQFTQLQKLQDESNPDFTVEVASLFFVDSDKLIDNMAAALERSPVDFKQVDADVHQLKGSSSSIGATRVKNLCITFRSFCEAQSYEGCLICLQQVKNECALLKDKLQNLFSMEQQIVGAGGSVPLMD
ncbi:histidine-containing phosphotransfer protein 1-like [Rhodamnia argentea]|uniref:Histidine-containing phosphotransfer protein n=1 Tax=Rhodamnia argentea TaxID=178133 RepID=A0A8B8QZ15_9MYRT|nr:histidine-containing phosphotransfer protein 1-like [Rhodamnia argentea]